MKSRAIKMPEDLWEFLGNLGKDLGYKDPRGLHSRLVREMVSAAATKWQESPYVARSARNVVLVTRDGHLFYRQVQVLKLNKKRDRLPCLLDFHASRRADIGGVAWFQPSWFLNHFAAWHGEGVSIVADKPLDTWVDRHGTDAKMADLLVNQGSERILTREIVAGLKDYVQWKGTQREEDRVDFPIDIPTLNLEIIVIVDMALYRKTVITESDKQEIANLKVEFRSRELARFEGDVIGRDAFNRMSLPLLGRCLIGSPGPNAEKIRKGVYDPEAEMRQNLDDLKKRIEFLAQAKVKSEPVVPPEEREALQNALMLPESFLYYKLGWPSPYFGIEVGIQWEKPEKP
ncbi:MAG: hypothetical protein QOF89_1909 [Acidobacteriota bacterium]|jgi:hypothetical protein|nr:hypothetical protein [Acidobacteriota bacterium]